MKSRAPAFIKNIIRKKSPKIALFGGASEAAKSRMAPLTVPWEERRIKTLPSVGKYPVFSAL